MKIFKKLTYTNRPEDNDALSKYLTSLDTEWKFDKEKSEEYAQGIGEKVGNTLTFRAQTKAGRKAYVWFVKSNRENKLTNITPDQVGSLSIDEYNEIVDDFIENVLYKSGFEIAINGSKAEKSISEIAGEEVYQALNKWASLCNPSTGNTNPYDEERWMDFVILCYRNESDFDSHYLERYLKEQTKIYDEEIIFDLIHDFEYGIDLLKRNDEF